MGVKANNQKLNVNTVIRLIIAALTVIAALLSIWGRGVFVVFIITIFANEPTSPIIVPPLAVTQSFPNAPLRPIEEPLGEYVASSVDDIDQPHYPHYVETLSEYENIANIQNDDSEYFQIMNVISIYEGWYRDSMNVKSDIRFTFRKNRNNDDLEVLVEYFIPTYNHHINETPPTGSYIMSISSYNHGRLRLEKIEWEDQRFSHHQHANFIGRFYSYGDNNVFQGRLYRNWGNSQFESNFVTSRVNRYF